MSVRLSALHDVRGRVNPKAIVQQEGLGKVKKEKKNPVN
jgi:hypothetical protein